MLVSGNINIETMVRVDAFPIPYHAGTFVPFGIQSQVSGVGYNIAKALATIGHGITFTSIIGRDLPAAMIRTILANDGIDDRFVLSQIEQTTQSVALYDAQGRRRFFTDPKDMREQAYPPPLFAQALGGCDALVITNVPYNRALLQIAKQTGKPIATDVHAISDLDDAYNQPFMEAADILFMSGERLPESPETWAQRVMERYNPPVLVIGLGADGALLAERATGRVTLVPAATTRPVVSTGGAGDALFAAFVHGYVGSEEPLAALRQAVVFAGHKVGEAGSSAGFSGSDELARLVEQIYGVAGRTT